MQWGVRGVFIGLLGVVSAGCGDPDAPRGGSSDAAVDAWAGDGGDDAAVTGPVDARALPPRPVSNPPPVPGDCTGGTTVCLLPWPNSAFEQPDPETPTGVRVVLPPAVGMPTVWSRLAPETVDGFSPVGTLATWIPSGVDLARLPTDPAATTGPESPILLLDADATASTWGEALPWRATISSASPEGGRVLFLTPLRAFRPGGRYAVLIERRLPTASGTPLEPTAELVSRLDPAADAPAAQYTRALLALLGPHGRRAEDVAQLWDFHVRSAEGIRGLLDGLAAEQAAFIEQAPVVTPAAPRPGPRNSTRYDVSITVPQWRTDRFATIERDASGRPVPVGHLTVTAILVVPPNATPERPAVPMLFGHGLSASAELMYTQLVPGLDLEGGPWALLLPDWDLHGTRGAGLQDILAIAGRLEGTAFAHSLLQSAADALVFSDALSRLGPLPDRGAVVRPGAVHYLGQSLGSMIGAMAHAVDPRVRSGVYNVGGGALSAVLREGDVVEKLGLKDAIRTLVLAEPPAGLTDVQAVEVVMAMSQIAFDVGDPAALAAAGRGPSIPLILQESLGDGIVVNPATELLARTWGIPQVAPLPNAVPGLETVESPTGGRPNRALTQFRVSADGFRAHLALSMEPVQAQAMRFFASFEDDRPDNDGDIAYDCGGVACDLVPR
jgi:hypothetical protein